MSAHAKTPVLAVRDRYEAAGLARNPFAAPSTPDASPVGFLDRGCGESPAPGQKLLVQVIGESGFGKSTQLAQWRSARPGPYHYIPRAPYRARWETPPVQDLVYGDEIDRMPMARRTRWFRALRARSATAVIGTHVDLRRLGERVGLDVVTHELAPLTDDQMQAMLNTRLDAEAIGEIAPTIRFSASDVAHVQQVACGIPGEAAVVAHKILAEKVFAL